MDCVIYGYFISLYDSGPSFCLIAKFDILMHKNDTPSKNNKNIFINPHNLKLRCIKLHKTKKNCGNLSYIGKKHLCCKIQKIGITFGY